MMMDSNCLEGSCGIAPITRAITFRRLARIRRVSLACHIILPQTVQYQSYCIVLKCTFSFASPVSRICRPQRHSRRQREFHKDVNGHQGGIGNVDQEDGQGLWIDRRAAVQSEQY